MSSLPHRSFFFKDDVPSPSYIPANSPGSMSVSENLRSTTPNTDLNLCLQDAPLPSTNNVPMDCVDDLNSISHVFFVRDVAPYQRTQNQLYHDYADTTGVFINKKNYVIRLQGVKTDDDDKYASILPEIKVSFVAKIFS